VEEEWLEDVLVYLDAHFKDFFLPSHDLYHHLRTWKIAQQILHDISMHNELANKPIVEAIMLATLFHDTGMVTTRNPSHGTEGVEVYEDFLVKNGGNKPVLHREVIRAIEYHDQKENYFYQPFTFRDPPDIPTVISISDDIDALGSIGIFRYVEIYLCRKVPLKSLGIRVLENVSLRYNHFVKAATLFPSLVKKTSESYGEIISFFDLYNQQLLIETEPSEVISGPIGVVNYIRNFSVEGKIRPEKFTEVLAGIETGEFVQEFFLKLEKKLNDDIS